MPESFSQRHRLAGPPPGTMVRDSVPVSLRMFLLELPHRDLFEFHELQTVICKVFDVWRHPSDPPYYQCKKHLTDCAWFSFYDVIEGLHMLLREKGNAPYSDYARPFAEAMNKVFVEQDIGWQIDYHGKVLIRGDEAFEGTVKSAVAVLDGSDKPTAAGHLRFAISALSARPTVDTSGAVAHATSAVECVLGELTGQSTTLGKYLDKNPGLVHPALRKGLDAIFGYASDEGARHGKEGTQPSREDAEFVLAVCAATCTLLTRKHPK